MADNGQGLILRAITKTLYYNHIFQFTILTLFKYQPHATCQHLTSSNELLMPGMITFLRSKYMTYNYHNQLMGKCLSRMKT